MNQSLHADLPRCVDCGKSSGPWVPNGDHAKNGAQLFVCAPGHGCRT